MSIRGNSIVSSHETLLKINNNFPAYIAIWPTLCNMLTISSFIFSFIAGLDKAQLSTF